MITSVLLRGYLSKEVLETAFDEINRLVSDQKPECILIIDSDGGDFVPAMDFVRSVQKLNIRLALKIYNAQSAAAFVTLSLRHYAEMKFGTAMVFHRGFLKLEAPDISYEGKVPESMLLSLREYNAELEGILTKCGVKDPKLWAELHGSGRLNLSGDQCLKLGVVNRLF